MSASISQKTSWTTETFGEASDLRIGSFIPVSFVDWPDQIVSVLFLSGCPWRCPYCHASGIQDATISAVSFQEAHYKLMKRKRDLDGVVFSGGEPCAQSALFDAVRLLHSEGFQIGLHTGGAYPKMVQKLIPYLSWVGFDIKAPWESYDEITMVPGSGIKAQQSLDILQNAGIEIQTRTTVHPALTSPEDIIAINAEMDRRGLPHTIEQKYRPIGVDLDRLHDAITNR